MDIEDNLKHDFIQTAADGSAAWSIINKGQKAMTDNPEAIAGTGQIYPQLYAIAWYLRIFRNMLRLTLVCLTEYELLYRYYF